ncbi:DUF1206 domain-containing protein [Bacillus salacetis]|uniref:DUF1206 domain-containing protein n=1 Tax=Bacillus salacetis TaxID=2315464 RepID=A0A3A1QNF3_9BACI|nr:DUF1206 domain-containing protein [Bacillus salacetis]RIW28598.1 DUF1206 domain-containing protein [Bacillus salacetis]
MNKETAKGHAKKGAHEAKPWVKGLGRLGYLAKGSVYLIIGILAFMAAIGAGGKTTGTNGALASIASKPFGEILLWILAVGLAGYVIWKIVEAVTDPENKGHEAKGILIRAGFVFSAIVYAGLAYRAVKIASNAGSGSGGNSRQTITAQILSQPFGQWMVGLAGVAVIGYGVYEIYKGYSEKFTDSFQRSKMKAKEFELGKKTGKAGLMARGVVFCITGYFLIQTAITTNPDNAKGLDAALSEIAQQPFGQWMLGLVALGLAAYGVFQILKGKNKNMAFY